MNDDKNFLGRRTLMASFLVGCLSPPLWSGRRAILGITLRPGGSHLVNYLEASCGKPLNAALEEMESRGTGKLMPDGTPLIRINPAYEDLREELIVHELAHLQLAVQGYPRYEWFFDMSEPDDREEEQHAIPTWLAMHVFDPIEHRIFYPRLLHMGYHPEDWRIKEMNDIIAKGTYGPTITASIETAARYCHVAIELGRHTLLDRMAAWYEQEGWSDALLLGREASAQAINTTHWTPNTALTVFVQAGNILLRRLGWTMESHGTISKTLGRVTQHYAQLYLHRRPNTPVPG